CLFGGGGAVQLIGPLTIWGTYEDKSLHLFFNSNRAGPVRGVLRPGAAGIPATSGYVSLQSGHGAWLRDLRGLTVTVQAATIELRMPWGRESFKVGNDGSFSGTIIGPGTPGSSPGSFTPVRLTVQGNAKSKEIRLEARGCVWTGTLP